MQNQHPRPLNVRNHSISSFSGKRSITLSLLKTVGSKRINLFGNVVGCDPRCLDMAKLRSKGI